MLLVAGRFHRLTSPIPRTGPGRAKRNSVSASDPCPSAPDVLPYAIRKPNRSTSEAPSEANRKLRPKLAAAELRAETYAEGVKDFMKSAARGKPAIAIHSTPARMAS